MNQSHQLAEEKVTITSKGKILFVLVLGLLTAFGPLSMDMYLPSLPTVTDSFKTTASLAQLSITSCLLGLAIGQLIFGPLSDFKGRRKPLIITLVLYAIFSLSCSLTGNIWLFIGLRFAQGFTGAAGIVIARAAARDLYSGKDLTKFMALLSIVNGATPILAPILGGLILKWLAWRAVFYILSGIGFVMLLLVLWTLPETLPVEKRSNGNIFSVFQSFGTLLKDHVFMGIALSQAFVVMSMFAYIAASPFVLQNIYHVTPQQFSLIFALNGIGIIIAAQVTGVLSKKIQEINLLRLGVSLSAIGSILLIIVIMFRLPLLPMMIALFLVVASVGIVNTAGFSLGMSRQGEIAGSASAFLGILPFGGGALVSPLTGLMGEYSAVPMGVVIFICSVLSLLIYTQMRMKNNKWV